MGCSGFTRQSAGKFAADLQTGLCEQAYACNKFHYFVRRESETTRQSKTGTCKRSVTPSLDHWYEQVHTLTIAEAGAQALVISDRVKLRIDGSRGHPSQTIRKSNLTLTSPRLVVIRITYRLSRFALWNLEATVQAKPTVYKVSNLESCLCFPCRPFESTGSTSDILKYDPIKTVPVPVAARSKAWVCGRSPAEIVGSNPTGDMDVCLL